MDLKGHSSAHSRRGAGGKGSKKGESKASDRVWREYRGVGGETEGAV